MMKSFPAVILIILSFALASCGFHLRGNYSLPEEMSRTYVDYSGPDTDVRQLVVRALTLNDIEVVRSREEAGAVLDIQQSSVQRDVLSKSSLGQPLEYTVTVSILFRLLDADGGELVDSQRVLADTVVVLDPANPGASTMELESVANSLRENAVWQMVRALSTASGSTNDVDPDVVPVAE